LLRLEHTHRPTLEDYVHRATRLGSSRSLNMRIGIRWRGVHRAGRAFQPAHAQPTGTGAALSLPVRWRFLLLSRLAPLAGLVTFRQTFVRRCQGGLAETQVDNPRR